MKMHSTLNQIGFIREEAHKYIIEELHKKGIKGIVPSHGSILMALFSYKQMTLKNIAKHIKRKQPTVTVLIEKLVKNGYVIKKKDPEDTRSTIVELTEKGKKFHSVFIEISNQLNDKMHKGMTQDEINALNTVLKKMADNF
ncbi:MAG: MarR family transcriptional regulator [Spirochaetes bacterium]|nr:MarR family transcriptional regulator [Spirochaetota bacterium]